MFSTLVLHVVLVEGAREPHQSFLPVPHYAPCLPVGHSLCGFGRKRDSVHGPELCFSYSRLRAETSTFNLFEGDVPTFWQIVIRAFTPQGDVPIYVFANVLCMKKPGVRTIS